jgi:hypothetical protein
VIAARALFAGVLLAGPTAIAFFSGGFFDEPREVAGIGAWALVLAAAVVSPHPFPRRWPGRLAVGALAALTGWIALSFDWAPLAVGVYLSFSRGALAALAVGLVVLAALAPARRQVRAIGVLLATGVLAAAASAALPAVRALEGSGGAKTAEGAAMLAVLLALMAAGAAAIWWLGRAEDAGRLRADPVRLPRPRLVIAACLVVLLGATLGAAALESKPGTPSAGASTARLASVKSNRYDYWRVALRELRADPIRGAGSGAFRVDWLRERTVFDPAKDAHSLYVETLGELGLVGAAILAALIVGVAVSARRAFRTVPAQAAGAAATLGVFAVHAGLDWDWEMPAVSLVAILLAGALVAWGEDRDTVSE